VDPHKALTILSETVLAWDLASDALAWGPTAASVLGLAPSSLFATGRMLADAIEPENGMTRAAALDSSSEQDRGTGVPYRLRYGLRTRTDRLAVIEETGRWFADSAGRPALACAILRVIRNSADRDGMTSGLQARADFLARIMDDVRESQLRRRSVTLVVGEADPERAEEGALAEVARRLRPVLRRRDIVSAYAPNRFALALTSCPAAESEGAVGRIMHLLGSDSPHPLLPGLRLGAASAPDQAEDAPALLRRAEEALAHTGDAPDRPAFSIWHANALDPIAPACGTDPGLILDGLNGRRFVMALRPAIEARTRKPALRQATLRFTTAGGDIVPVGDLGTATQRSGLSTLVDARLLELAADHLAAHADEQLLVEIASATLEDPDLLTLLAAHLGARPGIESRLVIGIPESGLHRMRSARGRLDAMKALGIGIALTEFGTGHASSKHLRMLPVDLIRLDGRLVQVLPRSADDRLLVRSLVDLVHDMGIPIIADWVDDDASARLLAEWGVDYLQGPLWGATVPQAECPGGSLQRRTG
jgi:EAL domain-containing protein (putative c-di-GMP-specific phosphodiesterase class I)